MSVNSKMTAIADEVRILSRTTSTMGLDTMASTLHTENTNFESNLTNQNSLIAHIQAALEGKGASSGDNRYISYYENNFAPNIGSNVFYQCPNLTSIRFTNCTAINESAFSKCNNLTSADFSVCTDIDEHAFSNCQNLTSINFPKCETVGLAAFYKCVSLTSISLPVCTDIGKHSFAQCTNLESVNLPECTNIGVGSIEYCSKLTFINIPKCITISDYALQQCLSLTSINLPECTKIGSCAFQQCSQLTSIYLRASTVCELSNTDAFAGSGITSTTGAIYVPASLLDSYKTAANWTNFANRIFAID